MLFSREKKSPLGLLFKSIDNIPVIVHRKTRNPFFTSILVADIEHATFSDTVWTPFNADDRKQSLKNVTSLSDAELVEVPSEGTSDANPGDTPGDAGADTPDDLGDTTADDPR